MINNSVRFLRRGEGRGGGGDSWAALNQFYQELGDTFHHPLLRGASLRDADAVGARIPAGATRATKATGREAVAVAEADVAALLANGARRRSRRAGRCETSGHRCRAQAHASRRASQMAVLRWRVSTMALWRARRTDAGGVLDFKVERAAKVSVCASAGSRIAQIDRVRDLGVC